MIPYIIIEDDLKTVDVIKKIVGSFKEYKFVAHADNVNSAIEIITNSEFKLCLADIQLLDGLSFEVFAKIPSINFDIIFITAFENYAIKAIKLSALDYILKPINENELKEILQNYASKHQPSCNTSFKIKNYIQNMQAKTDNIIIPDKEEYQIFPISDIEYIESDGCYTKFVLINKNIIVSSKPIGFYEDVLADYNFIRIHQQYMINISQIKSILKGQPLAIKLKSETILPVTRFNKSELVKLFIH